MYVDQVLVAGKQADDRGTLFVDQQSTIGDLNLFYFADATISVDSTISTCEVGGTATATLETSSMIGALGIGNGGLARVSSHSGTDPNVLTVNSLRTLDLTKRL